MALARFVRCIRLPPRSLFLCEAIGLSRSGSAPRHVLAIDAESGPLSDALKETCDSEVSSVAAESPMNHEFLHDAEGSPCQFARCEKHSRGSGLITLPTRFDNAITTFPQMKEVKIGRQLAALVHPRAFTKIFLVASRLKALSSRSFALVHGQDARLRRHRGVTAAPRDCGAQKSRCRCTDDPRDERMSPDQDSWLSR
jgi:hypothetical protein